MRAKPKQCNDLSKAKSSRRRPRQSCEVIQQQLSTWIKRPRACSIHRRSVHIRHRKPSPGPALTTYHSLFTALLRQPKSLDVLLQNASVHDHKYSCAPRLFSRFGMDHTLLHPHAACPDPNRSVHDCRNRFRFAENIDDIDPLRNIFQPRIGFFAQHLGLSGIHRDDAIARRLHVTRYSMARPLRLAGKSHDGDRTARPQNFRDCVHRRVVLPRTPVRLRPFKKCAHYLPFACPIWARNTFFASTLASITGRTWPAAPSAEYVV